MGEKTPADNPMFIMDDEDVESVQYETPKMKRRPRERRMLYAEQPNDEYKYPE